MDWTFSRKIVATIAALVALFAIVGMATLSAAFELKGTVTQLLVQDQIELQRKVSMRYLSLQLRRAEKDISIDLQLRPKNVPKRLEAWLALSGELENAMKPLGNGVGVDGGADDEAIAKALRNYIDGVRSAVKQAQDGTLDTAEVFEAAIDAPKKQIRIAEEGLTKQIKAFQGNAEQGRVGIFGKLGQVQALVIGGMLIAVVAGVALGALLRRSLMHPLAALREAMERVRNGEIDRPAEVSGRDEFGAMSGQFNDMLNQLRTTMVRVRAASESLGVASAQVAAGNIDLSARTEKAASSLQETASAMEQLNSTVSQSADAAKQASVMAAQAATDAELGAGVVANAVKGMDDIRGSSQRIAEIIGLIDSIAFQTNILALNAAVEAARAGEQGRGFAVVASEVRALAARSASAAKEIKELISASVEQVDAGASRVAKAGDVMLGLNGKVKQMHAMFEQISLSAQQQRDGITQVNVAVNQLDQMTQQNAALVEESAAAAASMKTQCDQLSDTVAFFRVGHS